MGKEVGITFTTMKENDNIPSSSGGAGNEISSNRTQEDGGHDTDNRDDENGSGERNDRIASGEQDRRNVLYAIIGGSGCFP